MIDAVIGCKQPVTTPEIPMNKSIINSVDNVYDILVHVEPAGKCQTGEKFGVDKDMV